MPALTDGLAGGDMSGIPEVSREGSAALCPAPSDAIIGVVSC
jgi:hypothetical protein